MTKFPTRFALMAGLIAGLAATPLAAHALDKNGGGKGAPAHAAPHASAPHVQVNRAAPHIQVHRAATPHIQTYRAERHVQRPHVQITPKTNAVQSQAATTAAQRRAKIRRARAQRASRHRQAAQPNTVAQPNAAVITTGATPANAQTRAQRRAARRAARQANRVTPQAARAGRFGARFAGQARNPAHRHHYAARRAWAHGYRAGFVAWYGPVFWPYAYSDIFDYAFWPYGYDDGFWYFAYDDFIDSLFWGEEGPPDEYVYDDYAAPPPPRPSYAAVRELCHQPGSGITAWPFAEIERKVDLAAAQKDLLGRMRDAAKDAAAAFKASCPADNAFPLTPPGRLRAMTARLQATLEAVQTVRPPLEAFYASLNDEQKERFNELGPKNGVKNAEARAALPADAKSCAQVKPGLTNLPIERIGDAVDPTEEQDAKLTALKDATDKAVSLLQAACPEETPLTPPGRLQAMETRLKAMIEAANAVRPALDDFYASLSNEQKARFNRIGREMAESKS